MYDQVDEEIDESRVVKRGTWLYDNTIPCRIYIQSEDVWPSFYDPEDKCEDDKIMPCFSVWFANAFNRFWDLSCGGYYETEQDAINEIHKIIKSPISWE